MKGRYKKVKIANISFTIDYNMRDYGNDPSVIKKADASQESLAKYGFPEEYIKSFNSRGRRWTR